jgi:hypothetical protein
VPYPGADVDNGNVLVTGLPRSGTTLACELLNLVPDVVALDEPMNRLMLTEDALRPAPGRPRGRRRGWAPWSGGRGGDTAAAGPDADVVADNIGHFLARTRASIRDRGMALTRHVEGRVLGSKVADEYGEGGLRGKLFARGEIHVDKPLSPGFVLVVKHNSGFAAVLPRLVGRFPVTAIVRNPLSIISSWQTVPFPVQQGHASLAELLDPDLAVALARIDDRVDRQFFLLSWFFRHFRDDLPDGGFVRYEEMVASNGAALATVVPGAADLVHPLDNRNRSSVYDPAAAQELGRRLLDTDGPWWHFYTPDSVRQLLRDG